jgi:hypothetical protein
MKIQYDQYSSFLLFFFKNNKSNFRLPIAQDCHEMWSKEHKRLARRGWSENEIQAHFKEREIIEYQRYNQGNGKKEFFFLFISKSIGNKLNMFNRIKLNR